MLAIAIEFTGTLFTLWSGVYVLSLCYVLLKYAFATWRSRAAFRAVARTGGIRFAELQAFGAHTPSTSHSMSAWALNSSGGGGRRCNGLGSVLSSSAFRGQDHLNSMYTYSGSSMAMGTMAVDMRRERERSLEKALEMESVSASTAYRPPLRSFSLSLHYTGGGTVATMNTEHEDRYSPTTIAESSPAIDGSSEIAQSQVTCAYRGAAGGRRHSFTCRDHVQLFLLARNSVSQLFMRHFLHLSN